MINLLYAARMVLHLLPLNSSKGSCVRLMCTKGNRRRSKNKMKEFLDQLFKKKNQLDSIVKPFFTGYLPLINLLKIANHRSRLSGFLPVFYLKCKRGGSPLKNFFWLDQSFFLTLLCGHCLYPGPYWNKHCLSASKSSPGSSV